MKAFARISIAALLLAGSIAHAGETSIKCTAEAKDTEGKAITITAVRYHYGRAADKLSSSVDAQAPDCSNKFTDLAAGDWYFVANSVTKSGEGKPSKVIKRTIEEAKAVAPVLE